MVKGGYIYILTNINNTTLYVGVTSDIITRIHEHKEKVYPKSFTSRYNFNKLVYYESFSTIDEAILREKQLKAGSRQRNIQLIESVNPEWLDLYPDILKTW